MNRNFNLILFLPILLLTSCAFHSGIMTGNADLGTDDFQVLTMAVGTAKTTHVLGIGGLEKDALVYEAKKNLYRAYPLGKNQVYANVTVDFKRSFYFIVSTTRAVVTADLIQFGEISSADSAKYLIDASPVQRVNKSSSDELFYPGQLLKIYKLGSLLPVRILEKIPGQNKYRTEYTKFNSGSTQKIKESDLYLTDKNDSIPGNPFRVTDVVYFAEAPNSPIQTGTVAGVGTEYLIVKSGVRTLRLKIGKCIPKENMQLPKAK